mgnify:CR=1 FL=1
MAVALLILGIMLFIGLVVAHEWGHFIAARRNGVEVEEFGLGFPPRAKILSRKNGTIYSLNWLPLGGFVKLKGEHDADTTEGSYGAAGLWVKVKIMLAGVFMNLTTAFLLLTILALIGMPKLIDNQFTVFSDTKLTQQKVLVGYVEKNSPAANAGLKVEDQIIGYADPEHPDPLAEIDAQGTPAVTQLKAASELQRITPAFAGKQLSIKVRTPDGTVKMLTATLRTKDEVDASKKTAEPKGYLGVSPTEYTLQRSTWSAPIVAAGLIKQFSVMTLQGLGSALGNLFRGNTAAASSQVSGPVGIFILLKQGSLLGIEFILVILAIISLTLALINALPIPALDGGRLFVTLLFRAIRKPLKKSTEEKIHGAGFAVLLLLIVLVTIVDIKRSF